MRHISLYRKWRPRTFEAVAGQEPVVRTLRRAIETDRVAHAYLFSGPRGTGKTSTAKVLAMGLNCQASAGPTPEPDGTCESCRAIVNNSSMDVLEMDAASNRGIDEIRELRDKVNLAPTQGRMKVYIIDEVHMLTTEAFNALLKMLEEPPEHVVFVLATTEKHKVLPTIISRCQSFDFRRPGVALLSEKLREIADAEGIEAEPAALTLISREARGSFRDAEGLLDQLSSFADGPITAARVRELLGSVGAEALLETTDALYGRQAADALRVVDRLQNEGRDLSRFAGELVAHLRRLMLLPHAPEVALAEVGNEERAGLEEQASRIPNTEVVRMIGSIGDALSRTKRGGDPKLELELTFMKLARDYTEPSVDALLGRLEALENAVASGGVVVSTPRPEETGPRAAERAVPEAAMPKAVADEGPTAKRDMPMAPEAVAGEVPIGEEEAAGDEADAILEGDVERKDGGEAVAGVGALVTQWGQIIQDLKDRKQALTATVFAEGHPSRLDDGVLEITFPQESDFYAREAGKPRHGEALGEVVENRFGMRPKLELRVTGSSEPATAAPATAAPAREAPTVEGLVGAVDGAVSPVRQPSRDVFEADPEPAPWPEEEPPLGDVAESSDTVSGRKAEQEEVAESGGEGAGDDDTIQDPREVLAMALDLFGPDGKFSEDTRDRGN